MPPADILAIRSYDFGIHFEADFMPTDQSAILPSFIAQLVLALGIRKAIRRGSLSSFGLEDHLSFLHRLPVDRDATTDGYNLRSSTAAGKNHYR